jgi:hypothetical protein
MDIRGDRSISDGRIDVLIAGPLTRIIVVLVLEVVLDVQGVVLDGLIEIGGFEIVMIDRLAGIRSHTFSSTVSFSSHHSPTLMASFNGAIQVKQNDYLERQNQFRHRFR